jgi:L-ribulose-5-phosphate 4-epimerase
VHKLQQQYQEQIQELVDACVRVAELGYVTSHGGNLSYRVDGSVVLITPTKVAKRKIKFDDVCIIDMDGNVLFAKEGRKPTGETPFHLRIFKKRPDVKGIVHAHPPVMTGFAIASTDLLALPTLPEPIIEVGPMLTVDYEEPLTEALAQAFDDKLDYGNAFLMKNHGALVVSTESVERALDFFEMMEAAAKSLLVAKLLGGVDTLSKEDVENLERTMKTRNLPMPGAPGRVSGLVELFFGEK